jgi:uncharacterized protein (DUF2336 family)
MKLTRAVSRTYDDRAGNGGLIVELTTLFVLPVTHRRQDIDAFEELMASLFADAPLHERVRAAVSVADRADLPSSIAALMAADDIEVAAPILTRSPALATIDRIRIIGNRGEAHRTAIATRGDLEDAVISALLVHGGPETIAALSANTRLALSPKQLDLLIDRVIAAGQVIEALPPALEPGAARRIDLFFALSSRDRRGALIAFDAETAFRRIEKRGRRTPPDVRPGLQQRLIDAVFAGQTETYASLIAEALNIEPALGNRIARDPGGEPVVIALKAAGLDATDITSILVRSDPAFGWTYHTIRDLVRLYDVISWRTAEAILDRWAASSGQRLTRDVPLRETVERPSRQRPLWSGQRSGVRVESHDSQRNQAIGPANRA